MSDSTSSSSHVWRSSRRRGSVSSLPRMLRGDVWSATSTMAPSRDLVALAVTARLARELVRTEPAEAESLLEEVSLQANEALGTLRDLARGIFPTALADRGLAAALEAHVAKVSPRPTFETDAVLGTRRFTPELEAGVYFCILEALQNCSMYAPDAPARVELASDDGWLVFSVTDQGPGFDQATTVPGRLPMRGSDVVDREGASQSLERASAVGSQQSDR